jgi:hypothetical protein
MVFSLVFHDFFVSFLCFLLHSLAPALIWLLSARPSCTMPKFAEKLRVLNRVGDEMLQRLCKVKRLCHWAFLNDKSVVLSIRKFPQIDGKVGYTNLLNRTT